MSTVSIIDKKVRAAAITRAWPGAIFACKRVGNNTLVEWDDTGPVPAKTAQEIANAEDAYTIYLTSQDCVSDKAASILANPVNQTIFEALWEMHRAIRGQITLQTETKAQYAARLKAILVTNKP